MDLIWQRNATAFAARSAFEDDIFSSSRLTVEVTRNLHLASNCVDSPSAGTRKSAMPQDEANSSGLAMKAL